MFPLKRFFILFLVFIIFIIKLCSVAKTTKKENILEESTTLSREEDELLLDSASGDGCHKTGGPSPPEALAVNTLKIITG